MAFPNPPEERTRPVATAPARPYAIVRIILIFVAVLLFLLAFFKVGIGGYDLIPLGLACGFAAYLPWW
jgi:1,4-dihydroxy-2-naphthoate octaprenyltransferase